MSQELRDRAINLNEFAVEVAHREAGFKSIDIAQIKEIIKCTLLELSDYRAWWQLEVIHRVRDKHG